MPTTKTEYSAHYPFALDDEENNTYLGAVERDTAEDMVSYVNKRLERAGRPQIAELVERKVVVGDWRPANTGIVPPYLTQKGTSDDDRSRQGKDDRTGRPTDGGQGASR